MKKYHRSLDLLIRAAKHQENGDRRKALAALDEAIEDAGYEEALEDLDLEQELAVEDVGESEDEEDALEYDDDDDEESMGHGHHPGHNRRSRHGSGDMMDEELMDDMDDMDDENDLRDVDDDLPMRPGSRVATIVAGGGGRGRRPSRERPRRRPGRRGGNAERNLRSLE